MMLKCLIGTDFGKILNEITVPLQNYLAAVTAGLTVKMIWTLISKRKDKR